MRRTDHKNSTLSEARRPRLVETISSLFNAVNHAIQTFSNCVYKYLKHGDEQFSYETFHLVSGPYLRVPATLLVCKVVRTPSGVYGRSLSLFQWREATWELSLPPGQDVSLTQGTSPAWWLVLICSWVDWSNEKLRALLKGIPRWDLNSGLPGQVRTL